MNRLAPSGPSVCFPCTIAADEAAAAADAAVAMELELKVGNPATERATEASVTNVTPGSLVPHRIQHKAHSRSK